VALHQDLKKESKNALAVSKIYFAKGYEFFKESYFEKNLGRVIWYAGGIIDWENLFTFHFGIDEVDRGQFNQGFETEFATGCSFLIKREIVENFGLFNETYFLYYEDADLSQRLIKMGYKLIFSPTSLVYHLNGASSDGSGGKVQVYYQTRNRLFFFFKYGDWKIKLRTIKLALKFLLKGNKTEKQAVWHFFTINFGKNNFIK
jgi:GT2 family glycosyltransferase